MSSPSPRAYTLGASGTREPLLAQTKPYALLDSQQKTLSINKLIKLKLSSTVSK